MASCLTVLGCCSGLTATECTIENGTTPTLFERKNVKAGEQKCDLTVVGPFKLADGIGKQSFELIESLKEDLNISFILTRQGFQDPFTLVPEDTRTILQRSGVKCPGRVLLYEETLPFERCETFFPNLQLPERNKNQVRLAYTMSESTRLSPGRVDIINQFDAILVPDAYLIKCYCESGVKVPIFYLPLGLYIDDFLAQPISSGQPHRPFVFANFSTIGVRKNQHTLVKAFAKAFGNTPEVTLLLCGRKGSDAYLARLEDEISQLGLTNVYVEKREVDRDQYLHRFCGIDCYVNVALGEGFSIQPREAMLLGKPVIVADNTAQSTICATGLVRCVPSNIPVSSGLVCPPGFGEYFQCSVDDIAQALRDVYTNYSHYADRAQALRRWASQYSFRKLRSLYLSILAPKRVVLGRENVITKKEVRTTSKTFLKKCRRVFPNIKIARQKGEATSLIARKEERQ
jgi:glycosyltransferase involved in cell wall biosynthesis